MKKPYDPTTCLPLLVHGPFYHQAFAPRIDWAQEPCYREIDYLLAAICEMAYIFGYTLVIFPTNYREMAYIIFKTHVKWPTFYRVIADISAGIPQCFQEVGESQPLNYECLLTLQTGLRPSVGAFQRILS